MVSPKASSPLSVIYIYFSTLILLFCHLCHLCCMSLLLRFWPAPSASILIVLVSLSQVFHLPSLVFLSMPTILSWLSVLSAPLKFLMSTIFMNGGRGLNSIFPSVKAFGSVPEMVELIPLLISFGHQ